MSDVDSPKAGGGNKPEQDLVEVLQLVLQESGAQNSMQNMTVELVNLRSGLVV